MKRNTLFGAAAMLMAGAAIGGGAVITQNAMADDGSPSPMDTMTMINIDADGTAVQCTFTGEDVVGLVPPGIPTDDEAKAAVVVAEGGAVGETSVMGQTGVITEVNGELPELQITDFTGSLPADVIQGVVTVQADADGTTNVVNIDGSIGESREGTAEECAAMRDQALADLSQMEAVGGLTVSTGDQATSNEP